MKAEEKVQWVYQAEGPEDLARRYSEWAADYENDIEHVFGYVVPQVTVDVATKYINSTARILDAGAGTGLVGMHLRDIGFENLHGLDMSPGMLKEAAKKGAYMELHQGTLGEVLPLESDFYDAVIAAGVFGPRHAPSSGFGEIIRVTRPGGFVVFSIQLQHYDDSDIADVIESHCAAGRWTCEYISECFQGLPAAEPDILYKIWACRVTNKEIKCR